MTDTQTERADADSRSILGITYVTLALVGLIVLAMIILRGAFDRLTQPSPLLVPECMAPKAGEAVIVVVTVQDGHLVTRCSRGSAREARK